MFKSILAVTFAVVALASVPPLTVGGPSARPFHDSHRTA